MENQKLDRYVGNYEDFQRVYEVKKAQLEAAYKRQQQEISQLKDFVARNKARVSTRNMAMYRQKKLDKMDVIELAAEKPKPEFKFRYGRTPGKMLFETKDLVIGYDEPLSKPLNFQMERGHKIAIVGTRQFPASVSLGKIFRSAILNRKLKERTRQPVLKNCGRNFRHLPSMKCVPPLQNADSLPSILRAR